MDLEQTVRVARGDATADLALRNGSLINVYTGEIYVTDVIIAGEKIVALGPGYEAREEINLTKRYIAPGFINAHVHIEISMITPPQFARAVVPRGTTSVITDPHEIANVCGLDGIRYMLDVSEGLPLTVFVNAPSCVPASHMSTSGAELEAAQLVTLLDHPRVLGLAEMMNFPGLILGEPNILAKMEAFKGRIVDGHSPGVSGASLNAYVAAGVGSDHECTTAEEAIERLRLGMYLLIREATAARNLLALLPSVTPENSRRCCFCTDDVYASDLLEKGDIDHILRLAIAHGLDPVTAIRMATLNSAEWFRLYDRGAVAPGKRADLVVFADLLDIRPELVFSGGRLVAQDGETYGEWPIPAVDQSPVRDTIHVDWGSLDEQAFRVPSQGSRVRVIGVIENQVVTNHLIEEIAQEDGYVVADVERDILKMAVIERHLGTENVGLGFIHGFGLKAGALATSVANDHHNIIVVGVDDQSMYKAARAVGELGGGFAVAKNDQVLASVPLPVAGLMSDRPAEVVAAAMSILQSSAAGLGSKLSDPFMTLNFMALEVIPALKLTDQGLIDVEQFKPVKLFVE
jgi:adenine deaminase